MASDRQATGTRCWLTLIAIVSLIAGCSSNGDPAVSAAPASTVVAGTAPGVQLPPAGGRFSYQIGGSYPPPPGVRIVDRDHTDQPVPATYSICYVNAYQAQPDALDWWRARHPRLLLRKAGRLVIDKDWNEALFDISSPDRRTELLGVIGGWLDGCAQAGYQAAEADNLDSYTRSAGLLSQQDALAFGAALAQRAHHDRLGLAQKNAAELSVPARQVGFDFAIAEECQVYSECDSYRAAYRDQLIEIEYADQPISAFTTACAERGRDVSIVLRDRDVTPAGDRAHVERWC